jgi:hypothetical protein
MADFVRDQFLICTQFEVEEAEDIREKVREVSQITPPDTIPNRVVDLGEEPEDAEAAFAVQGERNPLDSSLNSLFIDRHSESGNGHVHTSFSSGYTEAFVNLLTEVVEKVGELDVQIFYCDYTIEKPFKDLDMGLNIRLPDDFDGEIYQKTGARFDINDEDSDYLFQKNPESETTTLRWSSNEVDPDLGSTETFIQDVLEEPTRFIEAL